MRSVIDINEAKKYLLQLLEHAKNGEEIIMTKDDVPCAKLTSMTEQKRELGFVEGSIPNRFFDALPEEELEAWQ